jgi:hypothetical protein
VTLISQWVLAYLFLPPILIVGYAANAPTALLVTAIAKAASKANKDEASMKLLVGAVVFPVTWVLIAVLVGGGVAVLHRFYPTIPNASFLTGLVAFLLSALGGIVALHYLRLVGKTYRSISVTLTRARRSHAIQRLRGQRSELYDAMIALAEGLDLPGMVTTGGRVTR